MKIKIGLAQYKVIRSAPEENLLQIEAYAREAASTGLDLLFLPEMATTGFDWNYNKQQPEDAVNLVLNQLKELSKLHEVAICGSFLYKEGSELPTNTLFYINAKGALLGKYHKMHLFTYVGEERHMLAGDTVTSIDTEFGKMGCSICYDLRFPELFRRCLDQGALFQALPSAFPHPRLEHWQTLVRARAIENQFFMIATNQCGPEALNDDRIETHYFGHSMVVDPWGAILLEADETAGLYTCEIDLEEVTRIRSKLTATRDRKLGVD
jgi:predicted amidohydrolase